MLRRLFTAYITLLSVICSNSQELVLINKLNSFFQFDHNLILIESTTIADRFVNSPVSKESNSYVPQTLYVINNFQNDIRLKLIRRSKNILMIIALKSSVLEENFKFLAKVKEFQSDNINLKIGLFFTQSSFSSGELIQLFQWFWQHLIIRVFVGFPAEGTNEGNISINRLNTFTFNAFGTFELINLTDKVSLEEYFPRICYNLRQHKIRIGIHNDINSFIYSKNNPKFGGPDGKLWQTTFHLINASYNLVTFITITDGQDVQRLVMNGTIDLGPQVSKISTDKHINLYPIYTDTVVIVVPSALPYSEFTTYLKAFTEDNVFSASLITILVLTVILTFLRYIKRHRMLLFQSATDVVNLLLYNNLAIDYRNLFRVEVFIILPLTITGFVVINVILSILTSHLTKPLDQPEINTFTDIERSPFPVMVPTKKNMEQVLKVLKTEWNIDWRHKTSSSTLKEYFEQILSFNTSICFIYYGSKVKNLLEHQKRLNIRGYRVPSQILSQSLYGYIVSIDYPLKDCLNEVIQWIMNAGLYWKWTDESYFEFVEHGYFSETHVHKIDHNIDKYDLLIFIAYCWMGCTLVFFGEVVVNRIKSSCFWKKV